MRHQEIVRSILKLYATVEGCWCRNPFLFVIFLSEASKNYVISIDFLCVPFSFLFESFFSMQLYFFAFFGRFAIFIVFFIENTRISHSLLLLLTKKARKKTVTRFCVPSESIICAVYKNTTNISLTMAFCKAIIELSTPWRWKIKWNRVKKETESKDERKNCKKEPFQFGWMVFVQLSHSHPSSESVYVSVSQR